MLNWIWKQFFNVIAWKDRETLWEHLHNFFFFFLSFFSLITLSWFSYFILSFAFPTSTLGLFLLFFAFRGYPYEESYSFVISDWLSRQLRAIQMYHFPPMRVALHQVTTRFIRGTAGGCRKPWCYGLKTYYSNWFYAPGSFSYCCFEFIPHNLRSNNTEVGA